MPALPLKKIKINLSDYPYEKDIEYRLLMAELSLFDVDILSEILHSSLKISILPFADSWGDDKNKVLSCLKELQKMKLYRLEDDTIVVDKEMRKYYESQMSKFDEEFKPDLEFLRGLLSKVPIHILPVWYAIPRTSDDIFGSLVEKYLHNPKNYRRYLDELTFDNPMLNNIKTDVFAAPDFKVRAKDLIKKYDLSREQFEEYMLLLEFNLVCCLSYQQCEDKWEEVITPLDEWRSFLRIIRDSIPKPIEDVENIKRTHPGDFGFVQDMNKILLQCIKKPITLIPIADNFAIDHETASKILSHLDDSALTEKYLKQLVDKLVHYQLTKIKDQVLHPEKIADEWLKKHLQDQAMVVYRYGAPHGVPTQEGYVDRKLKETERCLKRISDQGWIYFEDFSKTCTAPIGDNQPVCLQRKGKRWKYTMPTYTEDDIETLLGYVFQNLFQAGLVATGTHNEKACFCVTPFGRMTLN